MRSLAQISIILAVMFSCCYNNHNEWTGIYTRFSQHEFGTEYDTLFIYKETKQLYSIERRWTYQRIRDGKLLEPEYKVKRTTAFFDAKTNSLREEESGASYTVDEEIIYHGTIKYKRK